MSEEGATRITGSGTTVYQWRIIVQELEKDQVQVITPRPKPWHIEKTSNVDGGKRSWLRAFFLRSDPECHNVMHGTVKKSRASDRAQT